MSNGNILDRRNALIYGGGGSIGGAIAVAFATAGATVHLAGRRPEPLAGVAETVKAAGGRAHTTRVDALEEREVNEFTASVADVHGSVDICIDVTGRNEVFGAPLVEMSLADFERPVHDAVRSTFLTSTAAARHMIPQKSGVILFFGGNGRPMADLGGFQTALGAMEALRNTLACELGPHGIRVVTMQTNGVPEAIGSDESPETVKEITDFTESSTMLGRAASLADVANVAVFAASDLARCITASAVNITAGAEVG